MTRIIILARNSAFPLLGGSRFSPDAMTGRSSQAAGVILTQAPAAEEGKP